MKSMYLVFTSKIKMTSNNLLKLKLVNEYGIVILNSEKNDEIIYIVQWCVVFFYFVSILVIEKKILRLKLKFKLKVRFLIEIGSSLFQISQNSQCVVKILRKMKIFSQI